MSKICIAFTTVALLLAPLTFAQDASHHDGSNARASDRDMQRAIQFQRNKDRADARQARRERTHPSVTYGNANRQAEPPNSVPDPGEQQAQKHKK
jgi:hypothetical protein